MNTCVWFRYLWWVYGLIVQIDPLLYADIHGCAHARKHAHVQTHTLLVQATFPQYLQNEKDQFHPSVAENILQ